MKFQITHSSKDLHTNGLYHLAPSTSLQEVPPRLAPSHQPQPRGPLLFFLHTSTLLVRLWLRWPPPLLERALPVSTRFPPKLPSGLLLSGRSSLTTQPWSRFLFPQSIYCSLKHSVYWFPVYAHAACSRVHKDWVRFPHGCVLTHRRRGPTTVRTQIFFNEQINEVKKRKNLGHQIV